MDKQKFLSKCSCLSAEEVETIMQNSVLNNVILKIVESLSDFSEHSVHATKAYDSYKNSPYLKNSTKELSCFAKIDRNYIIKNELGNRIDEMHGTMFYLKERTKEFAYIAGLDPDEMRMAFGEGIQNTLEHGKGDIVEIEISIHKINTENVYIQMSFKYFMQDLEIYSIQDANKNADEGILNFESSRGRGEYLMREIMDERKFINGIQKRSGGEKEYFFQRIMRKYKNPHPKKRTGHITQEFKNYIDHLQDYKSALFARMDYFSNKKELIVSEETGNLNRVRIIMEKYGYKNIGNDSYRNIKFSFWESELTKDDSAKTFDFILSEIEEIIS